MKKALRVLEFDKIRERLAEHTVSDLGRQKALELEPVFTRARVEEAQQETEEASVYMAQGGESPVLGFSEMDEALGRAKVGATLSPNLLLRAASLLRAGNFANRMLLHKEEQPLLRGLGRAITTQRELAEEIDMAIISDEEIADKASPGLYDIRRQIRLMQGKVRDKLQNMIHSATFQKYLQDPIITVRGDRYCLPVKQESRAHVPGIVHDQSGSGATLFIEPMPVVEINNELRTWQGKEKDEIERILSELSGRVGDIADELRMNTQLLARLDFAFAKAKFAKAMRAVQPQVNDNGVIRIVSGRHPLLASETVVPMSLHMGESFNTLVITGPNTGGKTVTLKTVGLFALMTHAGLQLPAELGTDICLLDAVYADIGDEQSIEQSLSTFSSHMTNIVDILGKVTDKSLVLFDELGAGTDPTEGAALAISILETVRKTGARTLATTHYSELKAYALTTGGVENGAVEFDVESLRPTYRLSIGVPGKSNAFEIASRLGLSKDIIDEARAGLSQQQIRFEDVIAGAEYHRELARREQELAEQARRESVRLRDEVDKLKRTMKDQQDNASRKAKEEARRILQGAREESEKLISELKTMKAEAKMHEIADVRKRLESQLDSVADTAPEKRSGKVPKSLKPGDEVRVVSMNAKATVLKAPDAKGEVQVQAGVMKFTVKLADLEEVQSSGSKKKGGGTKISAAPAGVSMEIDVRGETVEEAVMEVDNYLDSAVLASRETVSIIHGKGTGALRAGLHGHLRRHPHVKAFRLGSFGEGEDGVTIVTLK